MRIPVNDALAVFREAVMPRPRVQAGYLDVYAFSTPEGKATLVTFWSSAEAADASGTTGGTPRCLEEYMTMFCSPLPLAS